MKVECQYCGSTWNIQDEHARAKSKGGVSTIPVCRECNLSKGDKGLMEWLRWVKKNDKYRWHRIADYHYGCRSAISQKIHTIRDEN